MKNQNKRFTMSKRLCMVVSEGTGIVIPIISLKPTISRRVVWLDLKGIDRGVFYEVYDVMGRKVLRGSIKTCCENKFSLDLSHLSSEIYFILLNSEGKKRAVVKRVVLMR
jgi:hypothetical protein